MCTQALFIMWNDYISGDNIVVDGGEWLYKPHPSGMPREMVAKLARGVEKKSREAGAAKSKL